MEKNNKNTILYIILVILCILLITLLGFIIYNKVGGQDTKDNQLEENQNKTVAKLDETKDWVYLAEYSTDIDTKSYTTDHDTYYLDSIKVPFININSPYATTSNNEINKVFDDAINTYRTGVSDKVTYVDNCSYETYTNNDYLSVILTYSVGGTSIPKPDYYTYNISTLTGEMLSYEEAYLLAGITKDNIDTLVETAIKEALEEKLANFNSDNYPADTNFDTYNTNSINNYKDSLNNNTLKYFLNNNELNIIVKLSLPTEANELNTIITIK